LKYLAVQYNTNSINWKTETINWNNLQVTTAQNQSIESGKKLIEQTMS